MSSRSTSPELTRRSGLPVTSRNPSRYEQKLKKVTSKSSLTRPPSPPISPDPIIFNSLDGKKSVRWTTTKTLTHDPRPQHSRSSSRSSPRTAAPRQSPSRPSPPRRTSSYAHRKCVERKESSESFEVRENERFSPIPWVLSPPISPPPLSLYSSIAALSSNITDSEQLRASTSSPQTDTSIASPEPRSPGKEGQMPMSPTLSVGGRTRLLPADEPLEEFRAVETALIRSPYIIPQDLFPPTSSSTFILAPNDSDTEGCQTASNDDIETPLPTEEPRRDTDRDSLVDLVMGYSLVDEPAETGTETKSDTTQSSPFLEYTTPAKPSARPTTPELLLSPIPSRPELLQSPSPLRRRSSEHRRVSEILPPSDDDEVMVRPLNLEEKMEEHRLGAGNGEVSVTRASSIQRRGAEYLSQFLARRKNSSQPALKHRTTQPTPRMISFPVIAMILALLLILSVAMNAVFFLKVTQLQRQQRQHTVNLESVMMPGRVGETFDIFTTPPRQWWTFLRPATPSPPPSPAYQTPTPTFPQYRHRGRTTGRWWKKFEGRLSFGRGGKREMARKFEEGVWKVWGKGRGLIGGILERIWGWR